LASLGRFGVLKNFSDHAANERTFLAWVRTAIAVMAFGFLVEKFDLFLRFTAGGAKARAVLGGQLRLGEFAGLALMGMGLAIVVVAIIRFLKTARDIDDAVPHSEGSRLDVALAALLFLLGCALVGYLIANLAGVR
jgi:putative membrane protein